LFTPAAGLGIDPDPPVWQRISYNLNFIMRGKSSFEQKVRKTRVLCELGNARQNSSHAKFTRFWPGDICAKTALVNCGGCNS
jgi:hypothetical protein